MLNEEQKKQIRQMAEAGCGYCEMIQCLRILRQEIVDYRTKLVEEEWTPAKENFGEGIRKNTCLWCGKEYQTFATGRKRKFCSDQCWRNYYMLYPSEPRKSARCAYCGKVFKMVNSKRKFCSHECYIKNRFWSKEDATELIDALMAGEDIVIPQWLKEKLKERL